MAKRKVKHVHAKKDEYVKVHRGGGGGGDNGCGLIIVYCILGYLGILLVIKIVEGIINFIQNNWIPITVITVTIILLTIFFSRKK